MWQKFKKQNLIGQKKIFKTEDSRFIVAVGLKVAGISLAINCFIYYFLFLVMRINYAFFKAHNFPQFDGENPFFDYVLQEAVENMPVIFASHIFLFFIGSYMGWLILRPFRILGEYSEEVIGQPNTIYSVEQFSTYVLLTRFSEFFFEYLRDSRRKGELHPHSIPPQYSKIHQPVTDRIFMLHFGLLLIIISICSSLLIIESSSALFISMVELATKTLSGNAPMVKFFSQQMFVLDEIVALSIFLISVCYIMLGFHLYAKVSGAAFGIFSTMRSFMKGNYSSRVHLLGFAHVREYTRKLNKYLDYAQNNLSAEKPKE